MPSNCTYTYNYNCILGLFKRCILELLDKVHFTLTRASGYRIVDLFPPRFYDNVQIRCPGVGIVDIVKPSDVDRCDSDQEDVHVTQARIIMVTALSRSRD